MKINKGKSISKEQLGSALTKALGKAIKSETKAKVKKRTVKGDGKFRSISQLVVFELSKNPKITFDQLTKMVKALKPASKWQMTHFSWYKSAVKAGRVKVVKLAKKETK